MDHFKSISLNQLEQIYKKEKDPKVRAKLLVVIHKKQKNRQPKGSGYRLYRTRNPNIKTNQHIHQQELWQILPSICNAKAPEKPRFLEDNPKKAAL